MSGRRGAQMTLTDASKAGGWRRWLKRDRLENVACMLIGAGVIMLMQPLALTLFSYSFTVILAGTIMFVIVSHFPE
jgi:hypothetical protein